MMVGLTHSERYLIYNLHVASDVAPEQHGSKPLGLCCLRRSSATSLP